VAGVDDVIEYLEYNVALAAEYQGAFAQIDVMPVQRYRQS
jgi:hypothetical protein